MHVCWFFTIGATEKNGRKSYYKIEKNTEQSQRWMREKRTGQSKANFQLRIQTSILWSIRLSNQAPKQQQQQYLEEEEGEEINKMADFQCERWYSYSFDLI